MPGATGFSFCGIGKEVTKGTAVAAANYIPITSCDGDDTVDVLEDMGMRASMTSLFGAVPGTKQASFSIEGDVFVDTFPYFLGAIFGKNADVGGGSPWTHTFTLNNATTGQCPSFTIHDYNGLQARKYAAATCSSVSLRLGAQELLTYSAQFSTFASVTESTPTPTFSALDPVAGWVGTVNLSGSGNVLMEELDLTFTRNVTPIFTVDGTQEATDFWQGPLSVSGRMMLIADAETEFTKYLAVTTSPLIITITQSASAIIVITMTKVVYTSAKIERGDDFTQVSVQFECIATTTDAGASGGYAPCKVAVTNAVAVGTIWAPV